MRLAETGSWSVAERHSNMRLISSSTFNMGSDEYYREEKPVHRVSVNTLCIDRAPVTSGGCANLPRRPATSPSPRLRRYRPAARGVQRVDTSTSHTGVRCIARKKADPAHCAYPELSENLV